MALAALSGCHSGKADVSGDTPSKDSASDDTAAVDTSTGDTDTATDTAADTAADTSTDSGTDSGPTDTDTGTAVVIPTTGVDLPLVGLQGFSYTLQFTVGSQEFSELIDSGSTTAAVAGESCSSCRRMDPLYSPGTSATDKGKTATSVYGDGSKWSGEIYEDTAELPGLPDVALDFVDITTERGFFSGNDFQGILGLGPPENLLNGTSSYMDALADAGVPEVMAFRLCTDSGDMWIGGYDPSAATTDVQFTPMLGISTYGNPFYAVELDDVSFGDTSIGMTSDDFMTTIIDTGTSLSYVPDKVETAMLAAINADPGFQSLFPGTTIDDSYSGDCVSASGVDATVIDATLPTFNLTFPTADGGSFSVQLPATQSYLFSYGSGGHGDESFCWAFGGSGSGRYAYSLIGDTLLTGMLTVVDVDNQQMGFAPQNGCSASSSLARVAAPPSPGLPWTASFPGFRPPPQLPRMGD